ncbi:MAG: IPTL-CTERM sorting domain-containing protein, partial [Phycisphaerae bacterium]
DGRDNDCNNIVDDNGDSDFDGVFDCNDQCPGEDDTIDTNADGIPDCVVSPVVPTVSQWGLVILALLLLAAQKAAFTRRRMQNQA